MGKKTLLSVLCVLIAAFSARAQDGCAPVDLTDRGQPIEVERLQEDKRFLEKAARNEKAMAKPGELIFLFDEK
jgi:hypothetical protein